MYSMTDHSGVYAQVKDALGEFWRDFDIDEIISRAYEFDGDEYRQTVSIEEFWKIAEECDKSSEGTAERYDYREAVTDDIRENVGDYYDMKKFDSRDEAFESLYEDFWIDDAVTGNGSGSYTFNAWRAENYLAHNWDLLAEALSEFGYTDSDTNILEKGAEWCDVTIRCYLLSECLNAVLDETVERWDSLGLDGWDA